MPAPTLLAAALLSALIAVADAPPAQTSANPSEDGPPPAALFTVAPPAPGDLERYDAAIRASAAAAESLMGPLDGGWRLIGRHGRALYRFEIADRGLGPPTVEGAWRDLRRRPPGRCCGLLSVIVRRGHDLTIGFQAPDEVAVKLRQTGARWTGELRRGRRTTRVTLTRG